jgi:hypothetical protein
MEQAIIEMIKNAPWAAALILIVKMFLQAEKDREVKRTADAKEAGDVQRAHELQMANAQRGRELEINNLWASTVKNMMSDQSKNNQEFVTVLKDFKDTILEQYKKMGITQDLLEIAKDELRRNKPA